MAPTQNAKDLFISLLYSAMLISSLGPWHTQYLLLPPYLYKKLKKKLNFYFILGYSWFTWRREWQPTLVFLLGEFHGQRTLVSCISWSCKELDMTKWPTHRYIIDLMGSHGGSAVKSLPAMQETWVQSLGWEDPLEKKMATHSNILAWRIHRQRSLVGYNSLGCKELDRTEWVHTIIVGL